MLGVGLLVERSLDSIHDGESMRHQIVADRMFDAMEEELSDLIEAEEARSFLEYRYFYAPEGGRREALTRSPLSRPAGPDYIVGYFQLEPDGTLNSPRRPLDTARAQRDYGWEETPDLQSEEQQLAELTSGLREQMAARWESLVEEGIVSAEPQVTTASRREPDPAPASTRRKKERKEDDLKARKRNLSKSKAAPEPTPEARNQKEVLDTFNRGASKRAARSTKSEPVSTDNAYFQRPEEPDAVADADLPEVEPPQSLGQAVDSMPSRQQSSSGPRANRERSWGLPALRRRAPASQSATAPKAEPLQAEVLGEATEEADEGGATASVAAAVDDADANAAEIWPDEDVDPRADAANADAFADDRRTAGLPFPAPSLSVGDATARDEAQGFEPESDELAQAGETERSGELADAEEPDADPTPLEAPPAQEALEQEEVAQEVAVASEAAREMQPEPTIAPPPSRNAEASMETSRADRQALKDSAAAVSLAGELEGAGPTSDLVDVRISPLRGLRVDGEHLVLHRSVRVGGMTWRQGLVLRVADLIEQLQGQVLDEELAGFVDLRWGVPSSHGPAEPPSPGSFRFGHQFAAPFTALAATATLSKLPQEGRDPQSWVLLLSLLLGVVGLVGFGALHRMVSVVVQFAERRNNFVAAVSHELKTPLTAIRMYGEILREGMVPSEEKRQEYYVTITAESERLSRLIDNVLELSRLEKGTRSVHPTLGAIGPVLEDVARTLRPHARNMGFELELDVEPGLPSASFDRDALQQVLINLVDNALKFAQGSDQKVVTLTCERVGDELMLRVRDRGPGVPAVQVARVFQPFFRGERELTRRTKGTGIGLALVQGLVQQMGGRVKARNHPQGGFEVSIILSAAA